MFNYVVRTELSDLDDETGWKISKAVNERAAKKDKVETQTTFCNVRIAYFHS